MGNTVEWEGILRFGIYISFVFVKMVCRKKDTKGIRMNDNMSTCIEETSK